MHRFIRTGEGVNLTISHSVKGTKSHERVRVFRQFNCLISLEYSADCPLGIIKAIKKSFINDQDIRKKCLLEWKYCDHENLFSLFPFQKGQEKMTPWKFLYKGQWNLARILSDWKKFQFMKEYIYQGATQRCALCQTFTDKVEPGWTILFFQLNRFILAEDLIDGIDQ